MAWLGLILISVCISLLLFWKFYFLRNPERNVPDNANLVLAPADGKVVEILEFKDSEVHLFKGSKRLLGHIHTLTRDVAKEGYIVSIFMSPLDVHYNRSPIAGKVVSVKHSDGKFLAVNTFEAGLVNEKTEIIITGDIKLKMIQIAGFLARRIATYPRPQDKVDQGQVVGLINLGSQVTMVLPKSVMLTVAKGDRMVAGESVVAKINS